jgi:SAM-dependent methyltransferase
VSNQPATPELRYVAKEHDPYSSHAVILARAGAGKGRRLLDVGAAQGVLAQRLTETGFEVTCIEGDRQLAELARAKCRELIVADLDGPLPVLTGRYDVIVYGDILEHLKNPMEVFRALNQYLAPGGMIIVSVPNIAHLYVRLKLLAGRFDYMERGILDRTHLRFFTLATFQKFLCEAGVQPVEVIGTPVPLYLVWPASRDAAWLRALHGLNGALAQSCKTMFGYQLVAVCRQEGAA